MRLADEEAQGVPLEVHDDVAGGDGGDGDRATNSAIALSADEGLREWLLSEIVLIVHRCCQNEDSVFPLEAAGEARDAAGEEVAGIAEFR